MGKCLARQSAVHERVAAVALSFIEMSARWIINCDYCGWIERGQKSHRFEYSVLIVRTTRLAGSEECMGNFARPFMCTDVAHTDTSKYCRQRRGGESMAFASGLRVSCCVCFFFTVCLMRDQWAGWMRLRNRGREEKRSCEPKKEKRVKHLSGQERQDSCLCEEAHQLYGSVATVAVRRGRIQREEQQSRRERERRRKVVLLRCHDASVNFCARTVFSSPWRYSKNLASRLSIGIQFVGWASEHQCIT